MTLKDKLAALGLVLPTASSPPGAFSGAVRHGNTVTVSGQVPITDMSHVIVVSVASVYILCSCHQVTLVDRNAGP